MTRRQAFGDAVAVSERQKDCATVVSRSAWCGGGPPSPAAWLVRAWVSGGELCRQLPGIQLSVARTHGYGSFAARRWFVIERGSIPWRTRARSSQLAFCASISNPMPKIEARAGLGRE